jgi:hypothetical protein
MNKDVIKIINDGIIEFVRSACRFIGYEISLPTNQYFGIMQKLDENSEKIEYMIQFGFPQSGAVIAEIEYIENETAVNITKLKVFTQPPTSKNAIMSTINQQEEDDEINVRFQMGMDTGTKEYQTMAEIASNPNAIQMIRLANATLKKAEILGECNVNVPIGSKSLPVCKSGFARPVIEEKKDPEEPGIHFLF